MIVLADRDRRRRAADPAAARRDRRAQRVRPPARLVRGRAGRAGPRRHAGPRASSSAPRSSSASGPEVDVLARLDDGRIVAVRQRNIIATAFHPELAGETRFHRLVATMAAEHDDPGEGSGAAAPDPTRRGQAATMTERARTRSTGKVRAARLTDLAALGELSRLCQSDGAETPLARAAGQRPADRRLQPVPPAARRVPAARPAVRVRGGRPARRARPRGARGRPRRVDDRRARRDRHGRRGRHPLPPRPAAPARGRQARRGALPRGLRGHRRQRRAVHAGRVRALRRGAHPVPARRPRPAGTVADEARGRGGGSGSATQLDALALARLYAVATPAPVARLEAFRLADWERQGAHWRVPRSSLDADPALRRRRGLRPGDARRRRATARSSRASSRSAWPRRTSRTTSRSSPGPTRTSSDADRLRPGVIAAARPRAATTATITASSRPCEPTNHRSTGAWRTPASIDRHVTLLMKETLVRVAEPALVPAGVR